MPTHSETRRLPYSARQMYDLVADVEKYPGFLPWCAAARIRRIGVDGECTVMDADLVISFKLFRERFGSRVRLDPGRMRLDTVYLDGPFRHMISQWVFVDLQRGKGCEVSFFVDFEFRTALLRKVAGIVFNQAMQQVVRAFERRAAELYSPP